MESTDTEKTLGKREARKQDRREAILAVAKRSFLENGYSGTSMSAISAELGGSKATLWSYFPSKEELFAAVLDEATAAYRRQLGDLLKPAADIRRALVEFARSFLTKVTSPEAMKLHRLINAETARFPEVGEIFYRRAPARTMQMVAAFLEAEMAAGHLRRDDPDRAARVLTGLCSATQFRALLGQADLRPAAIAEEAAFVAEIFLRAYGVEPSAD